MCRVCPRPRLPDERLDQARLLHPRRGFDDLALRLVGRLPRGGEASARTRQIRVRHAERRVESVHLRLGNGSVLEERLGALLVRGGLRQSDLRGLDRRFPFPDLIGERADTDGRGLEARFGHRLVADRVCFRDLDLGVHRLRRGERGGDVRLRLREPGTNGSVFELRE
jgi:hypothetical protein